MFVVALSATWTPSYGNLVAYYTFDDAGGSTQATELIHGYTGTVTGGVTFGGSGMVGNSASFDGSSGYITASYQVLNNMATGTIMAWIYPTSVVSGTICSNVHSGVEMSATFSIGNYIACGGTRASGNAGTVYYHGYDASPVCMSPAYASSTSTLQANTWYHVAVTFSTSAVQIYINGILDSSISATNANIVQNDNAAFTYIGSVNGGQMPFSGKIDDFSVWSTILSSSNIATIYNVQRNGFGALQCGVPFQMYMPNLGATWVYLSSNTVLCGTVSQAAWFYFSCTYSPPHLYAVGSRLPIGPLTNGAVGDTIAASCPDANSAWTWTTGNGYNFLQAADGGNYWDANGGNNAHVWGYGSTNANQQFLYSIVNCPAGIRLYNLFFPA